MDLFTDTAAILSNLDLRSIMGNPGGMSTIRYTRISIDARFSGQFFFMFSQKKIVMRKKDRCAVLGCNNISPFCREIYTEVLFLPKKRA